MKTFKSNRVRIGAAFLLSVGALGAAALAQGADVAPLTDKWVGDLLLARMSLTTARDYTQDTDKYFEAKEQVGTLTRAAIGNKSRTGFLAQDWGAEKGNEALAFTVLQNQKLIEQNAEIIALLKAKK